MRRQVIVLGALFTLVITTVGIFAYRTDTLPKASSIAQKPLSTELTAQTIPPGNTAPTFDAAALEKYLTVEAALLGQSDNVSIYFKDESVGQDVSINAVRSWIPASTIKSFVVAEVFRQQSQGLINFNDMVTIQARNVVPTEMETDEFPRLREGTQATIRQLVEAMIIQSDNIAYNTLLDVLDRRNISTTLRSLGMTQTVVGEKLNLDDDQFRADLQVPGRQPNTVTAKDLSTFFDLLYNKKIPNSEDILSIFLRQKINTMIPLLLPPDAVVAHKTGDWAPIYHDAGIIYKPNDPFVLAIMTSSNDTNVLARLARVAYYRSAQTVGEDIPQSSVRPLVRENADERIYLAEAPQERNVLGLQTDVNPDERAYVVAPGDTLWSIAQSQYGSGYEYVNIIQRNALTDPSSISSGTTLILPAVPGTAFPPETEKTELNAADLGVTDSDLHVGRAQTNTIRTSILIPGAPWYALKQWVENRAVVTAPTNDAKIDALLVRSSAKLGEVKRAVYFGNVQAVQPLLTEAENTLRQATDLAKSASNNDIALFKIKQQRDVYFGVLHDMTQKVSGSQKEAYIDAVYSFYKKQQQDVQPAIASIAVSNPLQQKPIIGTVTDVHNDIATLKTDDGKVTQVVLTHLTPSRFLNQAAVQVTSMPAPGEKIAVVGRVTPQSVVISQFILRNVPKVLPVGHRGKVLEIDAGKNTIKIQDTQGKIDTIRIDEQTTIKSKDTDVSLTGIKAGSTITIVGTVETPTAPSSVVSTGAVPSPGQGNDQPSGSTPQAAGTPGSPSNGRSGEGSTTGTGESPVRPPSGQVNQGEVTSSPVTSSVPGGQTINATTVTVDKNASGKNEKTSSSSKSEPAKEEKKSEQKKESKSAPEAPPPAPPAVAPEKHSEKKQK